MINIIFILISILSGAFISIFACGMDEILELWMYLLISFGMYVACIVIYLLIIAILSLFVTTKVKYTKANKFYYFMVREACDFICNFLRVKINIVGKEKLPKDTKFLVVGNHTSSLDPIFIIGKLKSHTFGAIAKPEVVGIPFIGKIVYRTFILPIDRENPRNAVGTIMQAGDLIKTDTVSMILYPEGTRNKGDVNTLLPFKNGGFKIAQKASCPIVVVKTTNANRVMSRFPLSTKVTLNIVDVIYPDSIAGLSTNDIGDLVQAKLLGNAINATSTQPEDATDANNVLSE